MSRSARVYEHARRRIPGATQLLSKRPEQFLPGGWPAYYRRASGVQVEDLDGRVYTDVSIHAVGSCPLGYADPDVDAAVLAAVRAGSMATLNCPEEVELAELLCALHPWADQVRYARCGGEAMAAAVRIARAATGRDTVAVSGYHGWHDWYLAANLTDPGALDELLLPGLEVAGVPGVLAGTAHAFAPGDRAAFDALLDRHGDRLAAIALEPARHELPAPGWLEHVRAAARRTGAVLIFDEITSGFRLAIGGAHLRLGVEPDLAVFAKALGNGYPMAAVVGRGEVMQAATRTFLSSTYWSERLGPAAALATIDKLRRLDVPAHLCAMGERMRRGWKECAKRHGLSIRIRGIEPLPAFAFDHGDDSRSLMTLYTKGMLARGFLAAGAFYPSLAHGPETVDAALRATDAVFSDLAGALGRGDLAGELDGPPACPAPRGRN